MRWLSLLSDAASLIGCTAEHVHPLEPCKIDAPMIVVLNEPPTSTHSPGWLERLPRTRGGGYSSGISFSYPRGRR